MSGLVVVGIIVAVVVGLVWFNDHRATEGIDRNLLQATKGNKALAKRLLEQARYKYPGKSDRWHVEKILYDLERDGAGSARRGGRSMSRRELRENLFLAGSVMWIINSLASMIQRFMR
jgi:hypothetical protein